MGRGVLVVNVYPKDIRGFSTIFNSDLVDEIIDYNDSLRNDLSKFLSNYKSK